MMIPPLSKWIGLAGALALPHFLQAQIPAANLFQAPLLIHPALAGNTGKHRLAFLANQNDYYVPVAKEPVPYLELNKLLSYRSVYHKASNLYASYDRLWKGYGIGGFVTYSSLPSQTNTNSWIRVPFGSFSSQLFSVGLVVSPKLRIPHPVIPNEAKYTIAPSLMIAYKGGGETSFLDIPAGNDLSLRRTYYDKSYTLRQLQLQAGLLVNARAGYVGYNLGMVYDFSQESTVIERDTNMPASRTLSFVALQHSVCLGLVFPRKENSMFTFSPVTTFGISHAVAGNIRHESLVLSHAQTGLNWFGYLHQSLNFRYHWFLFGGSYTEYLNQRIAGYHVGVKFKSVRSTLFYAFWDNDTPKMEASLQFQF